MAVAERSSDIASLHSSQPATEPSLRRPGGYQLLAADELGLCARGDPVPICLEGQALSGGRPIHAPPYDPLNTIPTGERTRLDLRVTSVRDGVRWRPASGSTTVVVQGHLPDVRA